jgi:hypothetical protein
LASSIAKDPGSVFMVPRAVLVLLCRILARWRQFREWDEADTFARGKQQRRKQSEIDHYRYHRFPMFTRAKHYFY